MRLFWLHCIVTLVAASALLSPSARAEDKRPNILLMFTDDQPQNVMGFAGNTAVHTPHMDSLAQRGIYFDNAFVTTPICCSSRACLFTGQQMNRHGIRDFKSPLSASAFAKTYPAMLRKSGYRTGYLGKYAIGNPALHRRELCLPANKFDDWYGFPQNIAYRQDVDGEGQYLTQVMSDKAIEFLQQSTPDQPFCLTVAFKEPHGPFNYFDPLTPNIYENAELPCSPTFTADYFASQPKFIRESLNGDNSRGFLASNERLQSHLRTFYRTVTRADQAVGEILAALKQLKLDENTVIIFTSDHGDLLGDHGLFGKWLLYEDSIRVPLIVYDPRIPEPLRSGRRDELALGIDLAPTMLALAGITPPDAMQGKDLMPVMDGTADNWRSHFYCEHTYNTDPPRAPIAESEGIRTTKWKYIRYPNTNPVFEQLFDLDTDPEERTNLAGSADASEVVAELRALCDKSGN